MHFVVVDKLRFILTRNSMNDFPEEVQELLDEFVDIVVDELTHSLPPMRSMSHHIDLIPRACFPNK